MKGTAFQDLRTSIRRAGRMRRGRLKPARANTVRPDDVKSVRAKLKASQTEFAFMIGVSVAILRNWETGAANARWPDLGASARCSAQSPCSRRGLIPRTAQHKATWSADLHSRRRWWDQDSAEAASDGRWCREQNRHALQNIASHSSHVSCAPSKYHITRCEVAPF